MARLFGLFADLAGRAVLVIGGGSVATRKVAALLEADARVTVCAPVITLELKQWQQAGRVRHRADRFAPGWLDDCWLVVAATSDRTLNREVAAAAEARQRFVNVVDDLELSSVQVPAVVDRGALQVAISTAGAAPALGRWIRARLEARLDPSLGALVALAARFRARIQARFPQHGARRRFYEQLPRSRAAVLLRRDDAAGASAWLQARLDGAAPPPAGHVSLVGAGPGDAGLLTLHGLRALQDADVILHDRLASAEVLALARRDARRIPVGKAPGRHAFSQDQINALLVAEARQGRHVVRLKGGDPFVFGRGGEELQYLRAHGIAYQVVPGITAATACAAYAGIPLTHREHAQSLRFVTAHCRESLDTLDWDLLARGRQTLAIYMGVGRLEQVRDRLLAHGKPADTPFALVAQGTQATQRVIVGSLVQLPELAQAHAVRPPALLIVGEVASLARELAWFGGPVLPQQPQAPAVAPQPVALAAESL